MFCSAVQAFLYHLLREPYFVGNVRHVVCRSLMFSGAQVVLKVVTHHFPDINVEN